MTGVQTCALPILNPHPTPEIVRIPLEMLCLQIKAMRADEDVKTFLGKALNPPDVRAIDSAWATLRLLGAIEEEGGTAARLTPLGAHLVNCDTVFGSGGVG